MEELSESQTEAYEDIVLRRKSGMLSGPGGSGKSYLIAQIVEGFRLKGIKTHLTATTGIAAVLIHGVTLHSLFRIMPDDLVQPAEKNIARVRNNKFFKKELAAIQVLIIDEISMLDTATFERVDVIMQYAKSCGAPFGGIQMVLVGDFYQLPPVGQKFLFTSDLFWLTCDALWELKQVWRQEGEFRDMLLRMRTGDLTEEDLAALKARHGAVIEDGIEPTKLFALNSAVDSINRTKLNELQGDERIFPLKSGMHAGRISEAQRAVLNIALDKFRKDVNLPEELRLRIGTQVMLSFNLNTAGGLTNGSRGVVVEFKESAKGVPETYLHKTFSDKEKGQGQGRTAPLDGVLLPVVQFENVKVVIPYTRFSRTVPELGEVYVWQVPLRPAWASSIHRVQGQTLSRLEIALDHTVFEYGQAYVAVSRAKTLEGLCFTSFDATCIRANPEVKAFYDVPFNVQKELRIMELAQPSKKAKVQTEEQPSFRIVDEE